MNKPKNDHRCKMPTNTDTSQQTANELNKATNNKNSGALDHKWIKNIRALPSNQRTNDVLKKEYIDVNLNNSRKLIRNVNTLSQSSNGFINTIEDVNENLVRLKSVKKEFEWLTAINYS